jgi:hypothetical protein
MSDIVIGIEGFYYIVYPEFHVIVQIPIVIPPTSITTVIAIRKSMTVF